MAASSNSLSICHPGAGSLGTFERERTEECKCSKATSAHMQLYLTVPQPPHTLAAWATARSQRRNELFNPTIPEGHGFLGFPRDGAQLGDPVSFQCAGCASWTSSGPRASALRVTSPWKGCGCLVRLHAPAAVKADDDAWCCACPYLHAGVLQHPAQQPLPCFYASVTGWRPARMRRSDGAALLWDTAL